jgi:hypothetical protein
MPQMSPIHQGAAWPKPLKAYEYLRTATMTEWAWEYLRRNPDYRADARLHRRRGVVHHPFATGTTFTRMHARHVRAEAWGLCTFRRSRTAR